MAHRYCMRETGCSGLISHRTVFIVATAKVGSGGNRENCSGALNPKVLLGDGRPGRDEVNYSAGSWKELWQERGGPWWT